MNCNLFIFFCCQVHRAKLILTTSFNCISAWKIYHDPPCISQAFPEHPRSIPDRARSSTVVASTSRFRRLRSWAQLRTLAQKPTKAWAMMFTSRQWTLTMQWPCMVNQIIIRSSNQKSLHIIFNIYYIYNMNKQYSKISYVMPCNTTMPMPPDLFVLDLKIWSSPLLASMALSSQRLHFGDSASALEPVIWTWRKKLASDIDSSLKGTQKTQNTSCYLISTWYLLDTNHDSLMTH